MSQTWWMATSIGGLSVEPVSIARATDQLVVLPGGQQARKVTELCWYAETREEAVRMMAASMEGRLRQAQQRVRDAIERRDQARALMEQ